MKIQALLLFLLFAVACTEQDKPAEDRSATAINQAFLDNTEFDPEMAKMSGADEYGMKMYVMAFLKRGPNRDLDSARAAELQRAHLDNIGKMAEQGKLVLAGPFGGNGDLRGIYVFDVETVEEAEALTNSDPAIVEGSLEMELIPWYGSAGLVFIGDLHRKVGENPI